MTITLDTLAARVEALEAEAQLNADNHGRVFTPFVEMLAAPTRPAPPAGFQYNPNGDGTLQFIGTPKPGINLVPNTMPVVPREWGVGARFRIAGTVGEPMTVTRTGDGVVFAMHDGAEMSFVPSQCTLVEAAT